MEKNIHIKNISTAALSAIPIFGGPLSVIFDKYLPENIENKRNRFLKDLNESLMFIQEKYPEKYNIENDRFISIFVKCVKLAMEEFKIEKINYFKNIIVNSSLEIQHTFDLTTLYINWVQELTVDQIKLIIDIDNIDPIAYKDVGSADIYRLLKKIYPNAPTDYLIVIGQDLVSKKIIIHSRSIYATEMKNEHKEKIWLLSDLGKGFVGFISEYS